MPHVEFAEKDALEHVRAAMAAGHLEEAVSIARSRDTRECDNADVHLEWADICEELNMADDVIMELNMAIRDDPNRQEAFERLAEVYLDQGQPNRAARVWAELVNRKPEEPNFHEQLGAALRDAGEYERAKKVYATALEKTGDTRFKGYLKDLDFLDGADERSPETEPEHTQIVPQRYHLVTFTSLFAGREGVYARQWVSPTGESGYTPVQEPLTLNVAENHILGNYTIGGYPVRLDNTVHYIAFDFDIAKFAVARAISSEKTWSILMSRVHKLACRLVDFGAAHEIPLVMEDSGFKGRHCWIFLETAIPAGVAKKCGELMRNQLAPIPQDITIEVFPKQTSVKQGGLGNLIKLPLGIHKRTGKRAVFIQADGSAYPDQLAFLENIPKASRRSIYALIQRMYAGSPAAVATQSASATVEPPDDVPFNTGDSVRTAEKESFRLEVPYDLDRDPEFQTIMMKCSVLRQIVDKVNQTGAISKEETLVLMHSLGHLSHGPEAVNAIFQRCVNADPTLFLKSRLRGNPVSCPKIRARIPEVTSTVPCNCVFDLDVNLYPTPLIHVKAMSGSETPTPLGVTADSVQFQNLVQDYMKLKKQFRETKLLMERYEARLNNFFDEAAVDTVQTPLGEFRRTKREGLPTTFTLEI